MRDQRGQGTVEYVGVIFVVAALIALGASTVTGTGPRDIAHAVRDALLRALCIVTGGDCDQENDEPCVTRTDGRAERNGFTAGLIRIGGDRMVLLERRADDTVLVTQLEKGVLGIDAKTGGRFRLSIKGRQLRLGGTVGGAALARLGGGKAWIMPNERAARALVERLKQGGPWNRGTGPRGLANGPVRMAIPPADVVIDEDGGSSNLSGELRPMVKVRATLQLSAEDVFGSRLDTHTGERTLYVRRQSDLDLAAVLGGRAHRDSPQWSGEYAVRLDRSGEPRELVVTTTGDYRTSADLPDDLQPAAGLLSAPARGARVWVEEAHLDLRDPENLEVARRVIDQIRSPRPHLGRIVEVSETLADRLRATGRIAGRAYAVRTSDNGIDARIGAVVNAGVQFETDMRSTQLLGAAMRAADGSWGRDPRCTG
jgi:hypothetical protein